MDIMLWLFFSFSCLGLSLTPGPNTLLVLNHSVVAGSKKTVNTILGGVSGFIIMMAVSIFFLNAILLIYPDALKYAKYIGALYLFYLGAGLIISKKKLSKDESIEGTDYKNVSASSLFIKGFLSASANPKVLIFFSAFLTPFINKDNNLYIQFFIMALTFAVIEFLAEMFVNIIANKFSRFLKLHGELFSNICGLFFIFISSLLILN